MCYAQCPRAGEAGKGFAVVADEIRQLSEQTKTASDNIIEIINELNSDRIQMDQDKPIYEEAMKLVPKIEAVQNIDELNAVLEEIRNTKHALTSKEELNSFFQVKVKELGATYDKEAKRYIINA